MDITITTFNVENLFNRYAMLDEPWEGRNYEQVVMAVGLVSVGDRQGALVSYETTHIQRNNTAMAILDAAPDILAVQEVENIYTLRNFNSEYLDDYFDRILLIDGNDPRGIDVGLLLRKGLKVEVADIRTHVDEPLDKKAVTRRAARDFGYMATGALFSRDCLEVDVRAGGETLTLLVNHLKAQDGKANSVKRRKTQAARVEQLAKQAADAGKKPIVLGDLNVAPETDGSLEPLLKSKVLQNVKPADACGEWTHFYRAKKEYARLDYILPHKSLNVVGTNIMRKGLTTIAKQYAGDRYPTIGPQHTEASDHCPVSAKIAV